VTERTIKTPRRSTSPRAPAEPGRSIELAGHAALLVRPRRARALLVLAHGAGAGMRHAFLAGLAGALGEREIATLRWEFLAMTAGRGGPPSAAIAEREVREVCDASARWTKLPRFAGGKSFGGRMTSRAHAAAPLPGLRGIVFVGFPLHPPGRPGVERADHLAHAPGPLLFVQGTRDELADLALLTPVVAALGPRATMHVIARADHGFTRAGALAEVADAIARWIALRL
jgi:predicted alpha/beta-hydrolase family hydrolase